MDEAPETLLKEDEGNLPNANMEMRRRFEANCRRCVPVCNIWVLARLDLAWTWPGPGLAWPPK